MKKKKVLPLVLMVILLVVLIVSYFALKNYNSSKEDTTETDSESILSFNYENVTEIELKNPTGTYKFEYDLTDSTWKYADDKDFPLDDSQIKSLLGAICSLNAQRRLEDSLDNISEYGLENPAYTIKVTGDEGIDYTLNIGDKSSSDNYYAYLDGTNVVYMIDDTTVSYAGKSLYDMAKVDTVTAITDSDVYELEIDGKIYSYFEGGNAQYDYTVSNNWFEKLDDGSYKALDTTQMSSIISGITGMSYASCVNYKPSDEELIQYGLDDEHAKKVVVRYYVTVADETESETESETDTESESETEAEEIKEPHEVTYWFGAKTDDGNYYIRSSESSAVNTVSSETAEKIIAVDEKTLISKNVFAINSGNVTALSVTIGGKTYDIVQNGNVTDSDKYEDIYSKIGEISADSVITDAGEIKEVSPEMTLSYTLNSESFPNVKMEFTKYNGSYYQATINGNTELLVVKSVIDDIITKLQATE